MIVPPSRRSIWPLLIRGAKKRCPRCGVARLFLSWYTLHEVCPHCGVALPFDRRGDTWAFMYVTTAMITGFFLVGLFIFRPAQTRPGQLLVLLAALVVIVGSLPMRKGIAIAIEYRFQARQPSADDDTEPRNEA